MDRKQTLKSFFAAGGLGLEIGASYNPLVPKSEGFNVHVLDYASRDQLRAKYRHTQGVNIDIIEEVDFVSDGRPMRDVIQAEGVYDYIVASHVIEHTPDVIAFLLDCQSLLKPSGKLVLAVPDKRYCFDYFQPLSTTGAALQAWHEGRTRPQPGFVFDSVANDVLRGGSIGWPADCREAFAFNSTIENAYGLFNAACATNDYIDVHVWRFVPSSFRLIIQDLNDLAIVALREERFVTGSAHEFYACLSREGVGPGLSRLELARRTLDELVAPELAISPEAVA